MENNNSAKRFSLENNSSDCKAIISDTEVSIKDFLRQLLIKKVNCQSSHDLQKLVNLFYSLYYIPYFKDGLDLILTKITNNKLTLAIVEMQDWDTNVGCFLVTKTSFFDKAINLVKYHNLQQIIIRKLKINVLAHEMAHALEFASKKPLGLDFEQIIRYDLKQVNTAIITLKTAVKTLIDGDLKLYHPRQYPSELFARYFELLSLSRDVCSNGEFTTKQVAELFPRTSNFLLNNFNRLIVNQIDPEIAFKTSKIADLNINIATEKINFSENIASKQEKIRQQGWAKTINSNHKWQQAWENQQKNPNNKKD